MIPAKFHHHDNSGNLVITITTTTRMTANTMTCILFSLLLFRSRGSPVPNPTIYYHRLPNRNTSQIPYSVASLAPHPPLLNPILLPLPPSFPPPSIFLLIPGIRSGKRTLSLQPPTRHHDWLFIDRQQTSTSHSWHLRFFLEYTISCQLPPRNIWRVKWECSRLTNRSTWISRKLLNKSLSLILRSKNRTDGYQLQTVSQIFCPSISAYTSRFAFMLVGGEKKPSTYKIVLPQFNPLKHTHTSHTPLFSRPRNLHLN